MAVRLSSPNKAHVLEFIYHFSQTTKPHINNNHMPNMHEYIVNTFLFQKIHCEIFNTKRKAFNFWSII